jgi:hypothetical protein
VDYPADRLEEVYYADALMVLSTFDRGHQTQHVAEHVLAMCAEIIEPG